jgi:hypothetical protein
MPGLREDVIDALCAEDWPNPDYEVSSTRIHAQLQRSGINASKADVEQVLEQLVQTQDIFLVPDQQYGYVVQKVAEGLCPPPSQPQP